MTRDEINRLSARLQALYPSKYAVDEESAFIEFFAGDVLDDVLSALDEHYAGERGRYKPSVFEVRRRMPRRPSAESARPTASAPEAFADLLRRRHPGELGGRSDAEVLTRYNAQLVRDHVWPLRQSPSPAVQVPAAARLAAIRAGLLQDLEAHGVDGQIASTLADAIDLSRPMFRLTIESLRNVEAGRGGRVHVPEYEEALV